MTKQAQNQLPNAKTPSDDVSVREGVPAKVWVVHHPARRAQADALADALRRRGHTARSLRMIEGARHLVQDGLEGGVEQLLQSLSAMVSPKILGDVADFSEHPPRALIVDTAENARLLHRLRNLMKVDARIIAWVDGFESSAAWDASAIDAMIAPTAAQLRAAGQDPERAEKGLVIGPLRPDEVPFGDGERTALRTAARTSMNAQDAYVAMFDGSCLHPQNIPDFIREFVRCQTSHKALRWVLYYGPQQANGDAMRAAAKTYGLRALMFGDGTPVHRVLLGVDVLITPEKSALHDAAAWNALPILRVSARDAQHPLVSLCAMTEVDQLKDLGNGLQQVREKQCAPLIEHPDLVSPGDAHAIFERIAEWIAARLPIASTSSPEPAPPRDALAFEEVGQQTPTLDASIHASLSLTDEERKAQMVQLLRQLRVEERGLEDAVRTRDVWIERLQDAEEAQEEDLISVAQQRVDAAIQQVKTNQERVILLHDAREQLRGQKTHKMSEGPPHLTTQNDANEREIEARFVRLEQQRQLRDLRARMPKNDPPEGSSH